MREDREVKPMKAASTIVVSHSGRMRGVREVQPSKALSPIAVSPSGKMREVREQLRKEAPG